MCHQVQLHALLGAVLYHGLIGFFVHTVGFNQAVHVHSVLRSHLLVVLLHVLLGRLELQLRRLLQLGISADLAEQFAAHGILLVLLQLFPNVLLVFRLCLALIVRVLLDEGLRQLLLPGILQLRLNLFFHVLIGHLQLRLLVGQIVRGRHLHVFVVAEEFIAVFLKQPGVHPIEEAAQQNHRQHDSRHNGALPVTLAELLRLALIALFFPLRLLLLIRIPLLLLLNRFPLLRRQLLQFLFFFS